MQPLRDGKIRLAATVVLLRRAPAGPEVFMMQRPGVGDFPHLHVFPGGKVDAADHAPELFTDLTDAEASAILGMEAGGIRYWLAAIRECFEECGVLLADRDGKLFAPRSAAEARQFDNYRHELVDGELDFSTLCRREGLTLRGRRVFYFSHWITPDVAPRRFDTRFFVATLPPGQSALGHSWETADDAWIAPGAALSHHEAGRWQMISPTLTTLRCLAPYRDVQAIIADVAAERHLGDLPRELRREGMYPLR